eukprot:gnl/Hemi2/8171_TR2812_c0_g1_i1.p1 gnl/Hemi2/8171_TR2812_c0_g1~~gnl/Hemi2/8171_TR2812_c0_g1_i1.p1  ORF type:complete len:232 (+),score=61.54 gnl/Hemi2/8171_TR2812_c0_g1_i1:96-791(+)
MWLRLVGSLLLLVCLQALLASCAQVQRPSGAIAMNFAKRSLLDTLMEVFDEAEELPADSRSIVGRLDPKLLPPSRHDLVMSRPGAAKADISGQCDATYEVCCWNGNVACRSSKLLQQGYCRDADEGILYLNADWDDTKQCCSIINGVIYFCPSSAGSVFGCCKSSKACKIGQYFYTNRYCYETLPYSPVSEGIYKQEQLNKPANVNAALAQSPLPLLATLLASALLPALAI